MFKFIKTKSPNILPAANRGFTLVELLISIAIFVFMTAFLVSKYGTFNGTILTTNLAYDMAITIRQAQSYGIHVRQGPTGSFNDSYGAYFNTQGAGEDTKFRLFTDIGGANPTDDPDFFYNAGEVLSTSNLKSGMSIKSLCAANTEGAGDATAASTHSLSIVFKRPDPDAIITVNNPGGAVMKYAKITIQSKDGVTRHVVVRSNGQISIEN